MTVRVNKPAFNLREKLSELTSKFGLKGTELARAETVQDARDLISAGRKNLIINGDMRIAQRGTSFNYTGTGQDSVGKFAVDRFKLKTFGTTFPSGDYLTFSQDTDVPSNSSFTNSIKVEALQDLPIVSGNTAIRGFWTNYNIEGLDSDHLKWGTANAKSITISFWVKATKGGTIVLRLSNSDATDTSYVSEVTIDSANSWQYVTRTIPGPTFGTFKTDNTIGVQVQFTYGIEPTWITTSTLDQWLSGNLAGSTTQSNMLSTTGDSIWITGVQAEIGKNATEFEHRSYGEELALCQRYCFRATGNSSDETAIGTGHVRDTDTVQAYVTLPVTMRDHSQSVTENGMDGISGATNVPVSLTSSFDEGKSCIGVNLDADTGTPFTTGRGVVVRLTANTGSFFQVESEL